MVYFVISLLSLMLLGAGIALIGYTLGSNGNRIIDVLLGRPQLLHVQTRAARRVRASIRALPRRPLSLRAAA